MNLIKNLDYPRRIICLTEESVETLFLLGQQDRIVGVSAFVKRPDEAQQLPKVSFFTSSNYPKILAHKPDLILGHSDIQKDIARDLIELGQNVFIANHRSISEIFSYIHMLGRLTGADEASSLVLERLESKVQEAREFAKTLPRKPRVYFEEWDDPMISAIQWVSELIELCGGEDIFATKSQGVLAKERFVSHEDVIKANPDIIFGCWCGKKVKTDSIKTRSGYENIRAVQNRKVFELKPEIFLQPGPAPLLAGIDILIEYFSEVSYD